MIDFDGIEEWMPDLSAALAPHLPASVGQRLQAAEPKFVEDALNIVFELVDRDVVIDATLEWLRSKTLLGYHGTRLTDTEAATVRNQGLVPLKATSRRVRLVRALSGHPRWCDVAEHLDDAIRVHGEGCKAGRRENQVHLTVSRSGLVQGFNHYLTHGAEFDQHVAHALLGPDGVELLTHDGVPRVIHVGVPGPQALAAAHPIFSIEDVRNMGELPNLVREFLEAWSYRQAHPTFQCHTLKVDSGMIFRSMIPSEWIMKIEDVSL